MIRVNNDVIMNILNTVNENGYYKIPSEYQDKSIYTIEGDKFVVFYGDENFFGEEFNTFEEAKAWAEM